MCSAKLRHKIKQAVPTASKVECLPLPGSTNSLGLRLIVRGTEPVSLPLVSPSPKHPACLPASHQSQAIHSAEPGCLLSDLGTAQSVKHDLHCAHLSRNFLALALLGSAFQHFLGLSTSLGYLGWLKFVCGLYKHSVIR